MEWCQADPGQRRDRLSAPGGTVRRAGLWRWKGRIRLQRRRVRSQVQAPGATKVGQSVDYRMEFFVPKNFSYPGERSFPSGTRLLIAEWKRSEGIKNHVYEILLDSRRGATFELSLCIKPSDFGRWNSFTLRIKWSRGTDGFMEARCNGRLVLQRLNNPYRDPVNLPDPTEQAAMRAGTADTRRSTARSAGPISAQPSDYGGWGSRHRLAPFPKDGIEIRVRNLEVAKLR